MSATRGGRSLGRVVLRHVCGVFILAHLIPAARVLAQGVNEYPIGQLTLAQGVTLGPDGNLWFADMLGNIGRMTPSGTVTLFPTPTTGSFPQDIVVGSDGALWFTENGKNQIGRITTSGGFTEFPIPTANSGPYGIASGPDGALWFAEFDTNKIGRITTAGSFTEFPTPTAGSMPQFITSGPDGNLWFTEYSKNNVGRLTTAGVFTEFPIPTAAASPEGITSGPDGNLWFVENSGHKIGRTTTDGTITEFPLPTPTRAYHIASGPDGNLWFAEFDNNKIGRITTAGTITEFLIPTSNAEPYGITTGPNNDLWFTEFNKSQLGEVGVGEPLLDISNLSPGSGPADGGTAVSVTGAGIPADATVIVGGKAATGVDVSGSQVGFAVPALPPGTLNDVVVTDPSDGHFGRIPRGWLADFTDVPQAYPFHAYVESLVRAGVTAGCGGGDYCPSDPVRRDQMAVFLLKALHGSSYAPPACAGIFPDVPCPSPFADWIEELYGEGITGGCGGGDYCPSNPVRRDQMAAFLLKAEHGSSYAPPTCTGIFTDVLCPSQFADWIEQLANEHITVGCTPTTYCPADPNTRGQMAVFLTKTFNLQ
jgi:streptogramin lyase